MGSNVSFEKRKCIACGEEFFADGNRQKVCKVCTPDKSWQARYRRYGITEPLYRQIMEEQKGMCAMCLTELSSFAAVCVDHCHRSLLIRGILCRSCNFVLGRIEDRAFMERARAYLELGGYDPIAWKEEA